MTTLVNEVPENGTDDQVLKKNGSGFDQYGWETILEVPSGGSTGQVLTKTATGYEWQTPSGGGVQINTVRRQIVSTSGSYTVPSGDYALVGTIETPGGGFMVTAGTLIAWNNNSSGQLLLDNIQAQSNLIPFLPSYIYITVFTN